MFDQVERADDVLDVGRDSARSDPQWFAERIRAANLRGAAKNEIIGTASSGLEVEPSYYTIHYEAGVALLPKWGGSTELIQRFARIAIERSKREEGTQAYGRMYFHIARSKDPLRALHEAGVDWPTMKSSLKEIYAAYPDPWNLNAERTMTCVLGTVEEYRAVMERVGQNVMSTAYFDTPQWRKDCQDWAFRGKEFTPKDPTSGRGSSIVALGALVWAVVATAMLIYLGVRKSRRRAIA